MSALRMPIRDELERATDDRSAARMWRAIHARRTVRRDEKPAWHGALVGVALAMVVLVVAHVWPSNEPSPLLMFADGRALEAIEAAPMDRDVVNLSDGSEIARDGGAHLHVLANERASVELLLEQGRARFHVKKGGPRRWIVECGAFSVEVVGTEFVVEREGLKARVEVIEGVVLVRSDRLADGVKRLVAGESLELGPVEAAAATVSAEPPPAPSAVASNEHAPRVDASAKKRDASAKWRELAKAADYKKAYEELGKGGIANATDGASVDDLLALADVARLSGHPNEAIAPLAKIADDHASDPRASLAAFTLGQVLLSSAPSAAAKRFEQALASGLPSSLVEDATAHEVEAKGRAGDKAGAKDAAERYLRAYPSGAHAASVRSWLAP